MCRFDAARVVEAELELVSQISLLKRQHFHRRNSGLCRLPAEILTESLSFLSARDQLSVIRVCQQLRGHAIDAPSLWTHVDQIRNPAALSFVLERAKNLPVDITNLYVDSVNDVRFEAVTAHMHHIRTLGLRLSQSGCKLTTRSLAYTAFTTAAPVLQFLAFCAQPGVGSIGPPLVTSGFNIADNNKPRLSSLQIQGVKMALSMWLRAPSLRTFSFSFDERSQHGDALLERSLSEYARNLTTINIELGGWNAARPYPYLGPSVKKINIRWTKDGLFFPRDAAPNEAVWNALQAIHVTHMCRGSADPPSVIPPLASFAIPETTAPYQTLSIRASGAPNTRVHARAIDRDDRERVFCGLHPSTVEGLVALIPGEELSSITIATKAVALRVLSDAQCPVLSCIRLAPDTEDIAWVDRFARDISNIKTLERLEFIQEADLEAPKWTTAIIIRVVSCCIGAGNQLQEVLFLGFSPEAQCLATVETFSQQIVVDRNWREPKNERAWFTEPPFEWF